MRFAADVARPVLDEIGGYYAGLGLEARYEGRVFAGGHELREGTAFTADLFAWLALRK